MGTKVLSIVVSAITTGMGSASISCACNTLLLAKNQIPFTDSSLLSLRTHADDFDSDPENRRKRPSFYGYLPDEGNARTIMYVCMVLNSALLLLLRSRGARERSERKQDTAATHSCRSRADRCSATRAKRAQTRYCGYP